MLLSLSVADVLRICGPGSIEGETNEAIRGIASLTLARPGDLSFLGSARYRSQLAETRASLVLVPQSLAGSPAAGQAFLRVENPSRSLARLCRHLETATRTRPAPGVHATACVDPAARIGDGVTIGPFCVLESGTVIGANTWIEAGCFIGRDVSVDEDTHLFPGVKVLADCEIGRRVVLHPGVVVGSDGFGYETVNGRHEKVPQIGRVVIEDDVEIGANTTIDRARFAATIIREGAKIDNLVQVGHNVDIGRHCILCAQVGLAGTSILEDYVVIGGQGGVGGHLTVGKGSMIAGQSGVTSDLPPKSTVKGNPPLPLMTEQRINALRKRLPDLFKRVEGIEEHLGLRREPPGADGANTSAQ